MESQHLENQEPLNTSKYNDLRIILSQNSLKWITNLNNEFYQCKNPPQELRSQIEDCKLDKMASQLDQLFKAMLTDNFIQKTEASSQGPQYFCLRPVKDFTLTNVRQQAKIIEIKLAIEKLKGYRIECQNLTLVDEAELFDTRGIVCQQVLQPFLEDFKQQQNSEQLDKSLNKNQLNNMAIQEAQFRYARLNDESTLDTFNVFQEYPHCEMWRQTQIQKHFSLQVESQSDSRRSQRNSKKCYYLILDINLPMVQLNLKPKISSQQNIVIYANQMCSLYVIKYLIKLRILQNEINENNNNKLGPSDEVLKQALKNQVQTKFDDIEICHIIEQTNPENEEVMEEQQIQLKRDSNQLRDFGLLQSYIQSYCQSMGDFLELQNHINSEALQKHFSLFSASKLANGQGPYSIYNLNFNIKKQKVPPLNLGLGLDVKPQVQSFISEGIAPANNNLQLQIAGIMGNHSAFPDNKQHYIGSPSGSGLNRSINSPQVSLGIDFTFNTIKNVKKVNWKNEAPWYREITDGFCWLCYCQNPKCEGYKQLVVINKGYCVIAIGKELSNLVCPICKLGNKVGKNAETPLLSIKNCGFVNCEWAMRGILRKNKESKIYAEGRTYDNKLYTFRESDYRQIWCALDIIVKKLDSKNSLKNIPSARNEENNQAIDDALMDEGIGKLLDSNGFEVQHSSRLNSQFLQMIGGLTPGKHVQQDIMPDYMIENQHVESAEESSKKPPSMNPQQSNRPIGIKSYTSRQQNQQQKQKFKNMTENKMDMIDSNSQLSSLSKLWRGINCAGGNNQSMNQYIDQNQIVSQSGEDDYENIVIQQPYPNDDDDSQQYKSCNIF